MINWFTLVSLLVVFLFTVLLIYNYASKSTGYYVYFFVFAAYFLAFALVVLIPYDIYISISSGPEDIKFNLSILWRVIYWVVFALCW